MSNAEGQGSTLAGVLAVMWSGTATLLCAVLLLDLTHWYVENAPICLQRLCFQPQPNWNAAWQRFEPVGEGTEGRAEPLRCTPSTKTMQSHIGIMFVCVIGLVSHADFVTHPPAGTSHAPGAQQKIFVLSRKHAFCPSTALGVSWTRRSDACPGGVILLKHAITPHATFLYLHS